MNIGDVYTKHVRGSRYAFNHGKLFYKYPGNRKCYVEGDWSELFRRLTEIKNYSSGRFIINENKEIVVYQKQGSNEWWPYYVGKLEEKMKFDGIENDPKDLKPGYLWTGFASKHGSKYHINKRNQIFFKEFTREKGAEVQKKYFVKNADQELIDRIVQLKQQDWGSIHINEYNHVWSAVNKEVILNAYDEQHYKDMNEHFRSMTWEQKNTINKYSKEWDNRFSNKKERWFPIYLGQLNGNLMIDREDEPHIIRKFDEDYI